MERNNYYRHTVIIAKSLPRWVSIFKNTIKNGLKNFKRRVKNEVNKNEALKNIDEGKYNFNVRNPTLKEYFIHIGMIVLSFKAVISSLQSDIERIKYIHNFLYDNKDKTIAPHDCKVCEDIRESAKQRYNPNSEFLMPFTLQEWEYYNKKF